MLAKTLAGLEDLLVEELTVLGAKEIVKANRAVAFEGDLELLYKSNYLCRTALRVLVPIFSFLDHSLLYSIQKLYLRQAHFSIVAQLLRMRTHPNHPMHQCG